MASKWTQLLSSCHLVVLVAILVPGSLSYNSDFSFYPKDAQPCLNNASKASKCTGTDARDLNRCLCSDGGGFITRAAYCLGQNDRDELAKVYQSIEDACSFSKTPITVSEKAFMKIADGDDPFASTSASSTSSSSTSSASRSSASSSITSTAAVTSAPTPTTGTPSSTQSISSNGTNVDSKSSGLSQGAIIGIAVGASAAGILVIGGLVLFLRYQQKKKSADETSPMMAQNDYYKRDTATTFPPTEPSPSLALSGSEAKGSWGSSPSPAYPSSNFNKSPAQYAGPYAAPTPQDSPAMHGTASPAFEMDASATSTPAPGEGLVEMEGSAPQTHLQIR